MLKCELYDTRGHIFDVVLVMNKDVSALPVYVNLKTNETEQLKAVDAKAAIDAMRPYTRSITEMFIDMPRDPVISKSYLLRLNDKSKQSNEKRLLRAKSHVRQWYYMRRCYDTFRELESNLGHKFDAFVRLRDDNFLLGPLNPGSILKVTPISPRSIIISNCESWRKHGINDKGAIVSRMAAHTYFAGPLDFYYLYPERVFKYQGAQTMSPETWINFVYNRYVIDRHRSTS